MRRMWTALSNYPKTGCNPRKIQDLRAFSDSYLSPGRCRRSLLTVHLKPYWGKPAVRNFRGGRGNPKLDRARRAPLPYSAEHLFAWRTTTTARLTDDAEAMGNDLDPVLCTVGPATAHRRPHAIQLLGRLFSTDLPSPAGPTFRLSATELLPFRERVQDGIGMPGAMATVARPSILARIGHHHGPHRVGLDVPHNDEQVVAVLDDRRSEATLPDVAAGSLSPVVPPGVSDGQGLEDAADRLPGGQLEKQMKMVGHQAVAEERERVPCLGAGEIAKEHIPFAVGAEDIGSVVPAVDRVVNKVIACRSWKSSHESNLPT